MPDYTLSFDKAHSNLIFHQDPKVVAGVLDMALDLDDDGRWFETNETARSCHNDLNICEHGMTLMVWIRPTGFTGKQLYLSGSGVSLGVIAGRLNLMVSGSDSISTDVLDQNEWHHIALVYEAKNKVIRLYVNDKAFGEIKYHQAYQIPQNSASTGLAPGGNETGIAWSWTNSTQNSTGQMASADSNAGSGTNTTGSADSSAGSGTNTTGSADSSAGSGTNTTGSEDSSAGSGNHQASLLVSDAGAGRETPSSIGWVFGKQNEFFSSFASIMYDDFRIWEHSKPEEFVLDYYKLYGKQHSSY